MMYDELTPGAQRAMDRASARCRRGAAALEPLDLLAALMEEAENRAFELMVRFGLDPAEILQSLGTNPAPELSGADEPPQDDLDRDEARPTPLPHSADFRTVMLDAGMQARALDRGGLVGTEHLLAGLIAETSPAAQHLSTSGITLEPLRQHLSQDLQARVSRSPRLPRSPRWTSRTRFALSTSGEFWTRRPIAPVKDYGSSRTTPGSCSTTPGLTRRLKETRHRLAEALRGFDADLLIGARDTREDVGTHIMTHSEQARENPRAVLSANFKRTAEALCSWRNTANSSTSGWRGGLRSSATTSTPSRSSRSPRCMHIDPWAVRA